MKQKILDQVQIRLDHLKDMKQQVKDTKKQIDEKEREISEFRQEWQNNCKHVFYRVQRSDLVSGIPYTVGYHCCLCGIFEELQPSSTARTIKYPMRQSYHHPKDLQVILKQEAYHPRPYHPKSYLPTPPKDTQDFIGTVIENLFSNGKPMNFSIPPEYQAEVDLKIGQLDKLRTEMETLVENLKELEKTVMTIEQELDKVANLLNSYFDYPETVYQAPFHWSPDDSNYDPLD